MKKIIKPFIFLFLSCFLVGLCIITFFQVKGAVNTTTVTHTQYLHPVEGDWYYTGRNAAIDFMPYWEGACVNLTITGTVSNESLYGVYQTNSTVYLNHFNITNEVSESLFTKYTNASENLYVVYSDSILTTERIIFNVADKPHSSGQVETLFSLYNFFDFVRGDAIFLNLEFGDGSFYWLMFQKHLPGTSSLWYDLDVYISGTGWVKLTEFIMTSKPAGTGYNGYSFGLFHLTHQYTYNAKSYIQLHQYVLNDWDEVYSGYIYPNNKVAGSNYTNAILKFGSNNIAYQGYNIISVDSSLLRDDYHLNDTLQYVTKTITANNVEEWFNVKTPYNATMLQPVVTKIECKSALPKSDFVIFEAEVTGNVKDESYLMFPTQDYQEISDYIYEENVSIISINTRYRCLNLNPFINTLTFKFTQTYTPYTPVFSDIIFSIIPTLMILIIPPALMYKKFKRTGFLITLFVMLIILTVTNHIPVFVGILAMGILAMVFLKIMQQQREEAD